MTGAMPHLPHVPSSHVQGNLFAIVEGFVYVRVHICLRAGPCRLCMSEINKFRKKKKIYNLY